MLRHHILLVEDNGDDRVLLEEAFREAGYSGEVKFVHSGDAAVKYLQALSPSYYPSLVVLDFNMPGLNGPETLAQVKKLEKPLPVVFYSRSIRPLVKELLLAAGAVACVEKPDSLSGVQEVVRAFLRFAEESASLRN